MSKGESMYRHDTQEVRGVLMRTRERIADPARWTQWVAARDVDGARVNPCSPTATCWCLFGALWVEGGGGMSNVYISAIAALHQPLHGLNVADFNDRHTHADVLALLDRAVESCR